MMRWEVYRCPLSEPDQACGIREIDTTSPAARMVVSDTARDECCHHMRLVDAEEIVALHNLAVGIPIVVKGDVPPDQFSEFRKRWMSELGSALSPSQPLILDAEDLRDWRQATVGRWARAAFGDEEALSVPQRALRLLEEAVEMAQACQVPIEKVYELVAYVYARPVGEVAQELGGLGVTLLALANATGFSAEKCEADEVQRVLSKPTAHFAERNARKNAAGFKLT